jgi:hypothetical protein
MTDHPDDKKKDKSYSNPFDPETLRIAHTSDESLGIQRVLMKVDVGRPGKQEFFRTHPSPDMRIDVRIIELSETREVFLVTPEMAYLLPGETKLVRLTACISRYGAVSLWPVPLTADDKRENTWHMSARKAAEIAEKKWVRMQSNMSTKSYDVVTSSALQDPIWPNYTLRELLEIAFGDGRLIDREDHPVVRQLKGFV